MQPRSSRLLRRCGDRRAVEGLAVAVALVLASVSGAAAQGQAGLAPAPRQGTLVLDRVTVIDVEHGARLRDQRVVVVGNRIRALGSWRRVPVPPGARVVNAQGKYLIPGLWDMHVHATMPLQGWVVPGVDERTRHAVNAIYRQLLANGVTGIRDPGSHVPLDTFRSWKREIAAGQRVGPRLIVSGQAIDEFLVPGDRPESGGRVLRCWWAAVPANVPKENCNVAPHHIYAFDLADARHLVDSFHAAGADMIKTYTLTPPMYFAIAAEARRVGILFGGHVGGVGSEQPPDLNGLVASDSGARILDHGLRIGCASPADTVLSLTQCAVIAARLRRNRTWIALLGAPGSPGFSSAMVDTFRQRAMRYRGPVGALDGSEQPWVPLSAAERRRLPSGADWAAIYPDSAFHGRGCQEALLAYAVDLPVMPGSDAPGFGSFGDDVHGFMLGPVLCGVPPLWALRTATLDPVLALGATDSLGTVAVGKVADLVLLEGDPLADIWNVSKIAGVVANGRYYDRGALDRLLVEAAPEWRAALEGNRQARERAEALPKR